MTTYSERIGTCPVCGRAARITTEHAADGSDWDTVHCIPCRREREYRTRAEDRIASEWGDDLRRNQWHRWVLLNRPSRPEMEITLIGSSIGYHRALARLDSDTPAL